MSAVEAAAPARRIINYHGLGLVPNDFFSPRYGRNIWWLDKGCENRNDLYRLARLRAKKEVSGAV
jgi:hypothetical protein